MPGICGRCGQNVYAAEERLSLNKSWHTRCFTCAICNRTLDSTTVAENKELDEIYCKTCYRTKFATRGYGYGPNEPTLLALPSTSNVHHQRVEKEAESSGSRTEVKTKSSPVPPPLETTSTSHAISHSSGSREQGAFIRPFPSKALHPTSEQSLLPFNRIGNKVPESAGDNPVLNRNSKFGFNPPPRISPRSPSLKTLNMPAKCTRGQCGNVAVPRYPPNPPDVRRLPMADSLHKKMAELKPSHQQMSHLQRGPTTSVIATRSKRPFTKPLGGGEPCKRCQRPVYWAEMKLGYHGTYHQECFTCCCCKKPLESTTVSENQDEIYCKGCYRRFFGTHGIGYGVGAGTLQTP